MKKLNTAVYIDGFNLYYKIRLTSYKWLDLGKLPSLVLGENYHIVKIKYFTAIVKSSPKDPSKPERQKAYLRALSTVPNLEIVEGILKKRKVKGLFLEPLGRGIEKREIVTVQKYEEKESDVNIASHILVDSMEENLNCIILLSNDTDLKSPLHFARRKFGKKVGVISPYERVHFDLKNVSHFNKCITEQVLKESQFPLSVGKVKKPQAWD
ncbi:MAG: NYN domain-containing protein [Bacteriovoracales bacterium]|nr:NYN domain-containing protein [Bacteriovoracales bacterium]